MPLNGLDLFSGIGGLTVALEPWVRTVAYCEADSYAQSILLSRMASGDLPAAPIWDDVRTLRASDLPGIDIITGGFPCQDISVAGTGAGLTGDRSGLFFEIVRLAKETEAPFLFLENVPAIRTRGLREVVRALTDLRYDCRWTRVSAQEVGACHIRERWFLFAYSNSVQLREERREKLGRSTSERPLQLNSASEPRRVAESSERVTKPRVDRAGYGIPYRVDRHKALGNAVVPQAAREAFRSLTGL